MYHWKAREMWAGRIVMTMLETKERRSEERRAQFPVALGLALDNKALAGLVLKAVRGVNEKELNPPVVGATTAYHPQVMLAMLTYCYAIGVYGSQEVEAMMRADADFRALCGMDYPDWRRLKRFRRDNHAPLRRALEETFRSAWSMGREVETSCNGCANQDAAPPGWIAAEAQARIEQAMFIDLMAVE